MVLTIIYRSEFFSQIHKIRNFAAFLNGMFLYPLPRSFCSKIQLGLKTQELDSFHRLLLAPNCWSNSATFRRRGTRCRHWELGFGSESELLVLLAAGPWVSDRTKLSFYICKMKTVTASALFVHLWELNNTSKGLPPASNMVHLLSKHWLLLVLREQRNSRNSHPWSAGLSSASYASQAVNEGRWGFVAPACLVGFVLKL